MKIQVIKVSDDCFYIQYKRLWWWRKLGTADRPINFYPTAQAAADDVAFWFRSHKKSPGIVVAECERDYVYDYNDRL